MRFRQLFKYAFIVALTILTFSCSQQKTEWQGTIEEVDGVTVVKNPIEPIYVEDVFNIQEELSIGEAEGRNEYMFWNVNGIAIDSGGNIFVLDLEPRHIKVFDRNGGYLRQIGQRGQGPGELEFPTNLQITAQDEIIVHDRRSLVYFTRTGDFIKEVHLTKTFSPQWFQIDSNGCIIGNFAIQNKMALMKYDKDQEQLFKIAEVHPFGEVWGSMFSPILIHFGLTADNHIIWGISTDYELNISSPNGRLVRKIVTDFNPVEITEEDKKLISKKIISQREIKLPSHFQPLEGAYFSTDEEGRIFIRRKEAAESYFFDVFDTEGRYIAKIYLDIIDRSVPLQWKFGKLYTVEPDDEGYQYVKRYKVTWNY